ncbi:MAG: nucleotide exchange factor GrpE [Bacteroidota bacterium]|nr:nucleotide exchange factor GrpE [Bacteroidota bacterium]MDP4226964.1 nucleotide exchange factor GrpE [Bacteroidota bacterium]MDP4274634.1 nucleotide exchange factor GrpE [Bacteroidota bacterium]
MIKKNKTNKEQKSKESGKKVEEQIDNQTINMSQETKSATETVTAEAKEKEPVKETKEATEGKKAEAQKEEEAAPKAPTAEELLAEMKDKYIRLSAEFDNYRKRTLREKMELTKTAGESILKNLLPVVDDLERALKSIDQAEDINALKEGVQLIYSKFKEFLERQGVKEINTEDIEFNTDIHEAITKIPAPEEKMKGKILDVVQKGYYLNDKVIRYSKVVIGE